MLSALFTIAYKANKAMIIVSTLNAIRDRIPTHPIYKDRDSHMEDIATISNELLQFRSETPFPIKWDRLKNEFTLNERNNDEHTEN